MLDASISTHYGALRVAYCARQSGRLFVPAEIRIPGTIHFGNYVGQYPGFNNNLRQV
jgi:hypothetical protein